MSGAPVAIVIAIIVMTSSYVSAQTESLALCLPGYTPLYNSLGQTPCTMAAALGGACHNNVYTVEPLEVVGTYYLGPTRFDGESCLCSTVYYSLLSACGYCQGHPFLDWSAFDVNCSITYDQVFPERIPSSTRIPHYAYLDIVADNTFNVTLAWSAGGVESTPVPQATGTSTITSLASTGSSITANMASSTSVSLASDSTLTAWEIGVVVVVVVVFLGIVAVAVIVLRRRNSAIQYKSGGNIIMTNKQSGSGKLISQAQYSPLL